jgi:hypothetical protein
VFVAALALIDRLPALLVTGERWDQADYVLVLGADNRCLAEAAQRYRDGRVKRVLLVGRYPEPIVRLKIVPSYDAAAQRKLAAEGVEPGAIVVVPAEARNSWDVARALGPWLAGHPSAKLDVVADRLSSNRDRFVLRSTLASSQAARLRVFGVRDPAIVERGWWHDRYALKCVAGACLGFAFDYLHGPPSHAYREWDPAAYGEALE